RHRSRRRTPATEVEQQPAAPPHVAIALRSPHSSSKRHALACTTGRVDARVTRRLAVDSPPDGTWRSLVAHLPWEQGVAGSNPAVPTVGSTKRREGPEV